MRRLSKLGIVQTDSTKVSPSPCLIREMNSRDFAIASDYLLYRLRFRTAPLTARWVGAARPRVMTLSEQDKGAGQGSRTRLHSSTFSRTGERSIAPT